MSEDQTQTDSSCPKCQKALAPGDLQCPSCGTPLKQKKLGDILVEEGVITEDQLQEAIRTQNRKLGEILLESGVVRRTQLNRALKVQETTREPIEQVRLHLRIALVLVLVLTVCLAGAILRLEASAAQQLRLTQGSLSTDEVAAIFASDTESANRFEALRSLTERLKEPRTAAILTDALRSDKWYLRLYAAMLAGDSGQKQLVGPLIPLLLDPKHYLSPAAHEALKKITGQALPPDAAAWRDWAKANGISVENKPVR
jgi:hypothetical protein